MEKKVDPQDARQGKKGTPVLKVLLAALVLVAIAWFGVEMFGESTDPVEPAVEESETAPDLAPDDALAPADQAPTVEPSTDAQ